MLHCADVPIILVGNKTDLRDKFGSNLLTKDTNQPLISYNEGKQLAEDINARSYLECSAITNQGVDVIFEKATRVALERDQSTKEIRQYCWLL